MKRFGIALMCVGLLSAGCTDDDSPMQSGECTVTVLNETDEPIHVEYATPTAWNLLAPGFDVARQATADIIPGGSDDLLVFFSNELGTSEIVVTKGGLQRKYRVGFGDQTLTVHESDFAAKQDTEQAAGG